MSGEKNSARAPEPEPVAARAGETAGSGQLWMQAGSGLDLEIGTEKERKTLREWKNELFRLIQLPFKWQILWKKCQRNKVKKMCIS